MAAMENNFENTTISLYGTVPDSIVDGPGLRYAVFVQGCSHHCPGCHNPESQPAEGGTETTLAALLADIRANGLVHDVTLSGGEPFEQPKACAALAAELKRNGYGVWSSSGYLSEDLAKRANKARAERDRRAQAGKPVAEPHVIVSSIEHAAVLRPAKTMRAAGFRVTELPVDRQGFVEVRALEAALGADTVLVSVQAANSEVGSVQSVRELAACAHEAGALFHTDAVQALGKVPLSVEEWGVDAASFSAHKIGGPRGVGALYLKARTPFEPLMRGGGQESGLRSGTQNVRGAVGFAAAARAATAHVADDVAAMAVLRDRLYGALAAFGPVQATVDVEPGSLDFLPNVVSVLVEGLESETMLLRFDGLGIGVSGGSACSSHSLDPSHVLTAMGIPRVLALGSLRVSFDERVDPADLDAFCDELLAVVARWR